MASPMAEWATAFFNPSPIQIAIAVVITLSIPFILQILLFNRGGLSTLPSIVLIGPSGSGKTSLLTLVIFLQR
jgi:signal recognition particle receptor subunit beta